MFPCFQYSLGKPSFMAYGAKSLTLVVMLCQLPLPWIHDLRIPSLQIWSLRHHTGMFSRGNYVGWAPVTLSWPAAAGVNARVSGTACVRTAIKLLHSTIPSQSVSLTLLPVVSFWLFAVKVFYCAVTTVLYFTVLCCMVYWCILLYCSAVYCAVYCVVIFLWAETRLD